MPIRGRESEIKILESLYQSKRSEFLVVYGRRRIGKTFLIHQYFKEKGFYFELNGQKEASLQTQLHHFAVELADAFFKGQKSKTPNSWTEAFEQLHLQLKKIPKQQKIILFFDELPWLASPRSGFLAALDYFWNRHLSRMKNVLLITCGSAASWMIQHLLDAKGGLHNRVTYQIRLLPFTLRETQSFLEARNIRLSPQQIVEIYMALGGVAGYLIHVQPGKSAAQNINDICFAKNGALTTEFYKLYRSLFDHHESHLKIITELAKKRYGLNQQKLLKKAGLNSGGTSSQILQELEEAGFILKLPEYGGILNGAHYRLVDEFSLFFLHWMKAAPNSHLVEVENDYWLKKRTQKKWSIWAGYAFESLCFQHILSIKQGLGISGVQTEISSWITRASPSHSHSSPGAQIDLVIDRADDVINLCEIKFHNQELRVTSSLAQKLNQKKEAFLEKTQTKKALFTTLITALGTREDSHYFSAVDFQLNLDIFFERS